MQIKKSLLFKGALFTGIIIVISAIVVLYPQHFVSRQMIVITTPDSIYPGANIVIRAQIRNRKNNEPIAAQCDFILSSLDRSQKLTLSTKTNKWGLTSFATRIPKNITHGMHLRVMVSSFLGKESIYAKLKVDSHRSDLESSSGKRNLIHLMTDKNWYQPGQYIQFRTLCLDSQRFSPQQNKNVKIILQNALDKKVLHQQHISNSYGVCFGHLHLAEDFLPGKYTLKAITDQESHSIPLEIKFYQSQRIKITPKWSQNYLNFNKDFSGQFQCSYLFGQPLANTGIHLQFTNADNKNFNYSGTTDQKGIFAFTIPGENIRGGLGIGRCHFKVRVVDGGEENKEFSLPYYRKQRFIKILVEHGTLLPGQSNRAVLAAYRADGNPAPGVYQLSGAVEQEIKIGDQGYATFSFTPADDECNISVHWQQDQGKNNDGFYFSNYRDNLFSMGIRQKPYSAREKIPIFLHLTKSIYSKVDKLLLTTYQGQTTNTIDLSSHLGKETLSYELDAASFVTGQVEIVAEIFYARRHSMIKQMITIGNRPQGNLQITSDKNIYQPGDTANIKFQWHNSNDEPGPGHISMAVVDEGILSASNEISIEKSLDNWLEKFIDGSALPPVIKNVQRDISLGFYASYQVQGILQADNARYIKQQDQNLYKNYLGLWKSLFASAVIAFFITVLLKNARLLFILVFIMIIIAISIPGLLRSRMSANEGSGPYSGQGQPISIRHITSIKPPAPLPLAGQLRQNFPETLLFVPELELDKNGQAKLPITLADNITSWRISAIANGKNGGLAAQRLNIQVQQDLFIESDMPVALVKGDSPEIGWRLYNYSDQKQSCTFQIAKEDWFSAKNYDFTVEIPIKSHKYISLPITVKKAGDFTITGILSTKTYQDILKKKVKVTPFGRELLSTQNGILQNGAVVTLAVNVPPNSFNTESYIRVYSSPVSEMVDGLKSMLRMPYGCFEQTSSVNYPNILILKYLRKTNQSDPKIEAKAITFLKKGYARITSFEVPGGGFSLYGRTPANLWLSAYGLRQLNDLKNIISVDPGIIKRTENYIQNHLDQYYGAKKLYARLALQEQSLLESLAQVSEKTNNSYEEVILLHLLSINYRTNTKLKNRVESLARNFLAKKINYNFRTLTRSYGRFGKIELAAWIAKALSRYNADISLRKKLLRWLVNSKSAYGGWGTTQATILVLDALISDSQSLGGRGYLVVGETSYAINPLSPSLVIASPSENVQLSFSGRGKLNYSLITKAYQSWGKQENSLMRSGLNLAMQINKEKALQGESFLLTFTCSNTKKTEVNNCILDIGLAPGITPSIRHLRAMLATKTIDRYQLQNHKLILYINLIKALEQTKFEIPMSGKRIGKYSFSVTTLYEYYNPDNLATAFPKSITIIKRGQ